MTKMNRTIAIESTTYERAKAAGINVSAASEQGILRALGAEPVLKHDIDPIGAYFDALDATERQQIKDAKTTGKFKEPGFFGKTIKCPDPERRLYAVMRTKYRFNKITRDEISQIIARIMNDPPTPST